ncbi:MAG: TonB-dependent receptor [Gammaproteobacteria bacterium]|nr:MAG: TonB-dependent receptor [Gammaproteobacteria bacterium]
MKMLRRTTLATAITLLTAQMAPAAELQEQDLGEITVTATRAETALADVPAAISVVTQDDIQLGRQQLGLDESLARIPGLFMLNRYNFAQDLRIGIRGFGSRASFGIRGIKVFVDDLPNTLPDGQGGVDDIDIGSLSRAEVLRGPAGSIYGSAAGGVISLYTEEGPAEPFVEARSTWGSYKTEKSQVKAGGQRGALNYLFSVSHLKSQGYRQQSRVEHMGLNGKLRYDIDDSSSFTTVFNAVHSRMRTIPAA